MSEIKTARRRRTKSGEAAPPPPPDQKSPKKNNRYPLRSKDKPIDSVRWVDDDTLFDDEEDSEFEESEESESETKTKTKTKAKLALKLEEEDEEEEEDQIIHGIKVPSSMPVSVKIHLHAHVDAEAEYDDDDDDDDDDEDGYGEEYEEGDEDDDEIPHAFIQSLFASRLKNHPMLMISGDNEKRKEKEKKDKDEPPIRLSRRESDYFEGLTKQARKGALKKMKVVSDLLGESEIPYKFRVLDIDMPAKVQCEIIRKVDAMNRMGSENGESQKLRNWIDGVLRIPFGKNVPLPVTIKDGPEKCSLFLKNARAKMDKATYGMVSAKTQILQILAQWISNPTSVGNVIAMRGSMGVGKTSFARNGIAEVLGRPFIFTSLAAHRISHITLVIRIPTRDLCGVGSWTRSFKPDA